MANVKNNLSAQETKRRLICAAGEVFAETGLERTTIKAITDRAGTSLAAVNYHFKDKYELYHHVLREVVDVAGAIFTGLDSLPADMPPAERLRSFVGLFMRHVLDPERPEWHCVLMTREIQSPTATALPVLTEKMRAYSHRVESLVASLLTRKPSPRQLTMIADSIVGQCTFYLQEEGMIHALHPDLPPITDRLDEIIDHITRFSLAALTCFNHQPVTEAAKRPRKRAATKRK